MHSSAEQEQKHSLLRARKGFLGPIGDDIPSLIPLLFGLIVFFATFSFALTTFTQKNMAFTADRESLEVANTLKSDSYLGSHKEFLQLCNLVRSKSIRFSAGLIPLGTGSGQIELQDLPEKYFYSDEENGAFECTNAPEEDFSGDFVGTTTFLTFSFPVAVEYKKVVVPMQLVVVSWR